MYQDEMQHHGILGMKWGIRRSPEQLGHARSRLERKIHKQEKLVDKNNVKLDRRTIRYHKKVARMSSKANRLEYKARKLESKARKSEAKARKLEARVNKMMSKTNYIQASIKRSESLMNLYSRKIGELDKKAIRNGEEFVAEYLKTR